MNRHVAIITGAGSGIGAATAIRLADRYDLILTHLHDDADLRYVLAAVNHRGAATSVVTGDLTADRTRRALEREVAKATDGLDVVVSNAGAYPRISWDTLDLDTFRRQIEVNLITHAACFRLASSALAANRRGRVIAVSSVLTQLGRVDLAGYIAAKSGLEGLVRALARELGPHGITVNCVRAGSIEVAAEHTVVDDHAPR